MMLAVQCENKKTAPGKGGFQGFGHVLRAVKSEARPGGEEINNFDTGVPEIKIYGE